MSLIGGDWDGVDLDAAFPWDFEAKKESPMPLAPETPPCPECGAAIGHREVLVEAAEETTLPACKTTRTCSLGMDVVPRAEFERVTKERDEALFCAEAERRAHQTTNLYTVRLEGFNDMLRANQDALLNSASEAAAKSARDVRRLEEKDRECHAMLVNLTSTQARCTELLEEVRMLRAGMELLTAPKPFPED